MRIAETAMSEADPDAARYRLFEANAGIFGLLLIAVTWRLWMPQDLYPRVPLLELPSRTPAALEYLALAAAVAGLVAMGSRIVVKRTAGLRWLVPVGFAFAVVLDQHRLQPWVYQISALAMIFSLCGAGRGLLLIRVLTVGIYGWSAVGKLDFQFIHTVGTQMIEAMVRQVGLSPDKFSPGVIRGAALALPIGEAVVALLLLWARTRRVGVVLAVALHLTLVLILGPLGLRHQPGVLVWNAFFAIQAVLLFWPAARNHASPDRVGHAPHPTAFSSAAGWIVALMLMLPALERFGRFDHWLSWALYAPHSSRVAVYVTPEAIVRLPPTLVALLEEPAGIEDEESRGEEAADLESRDLAMEGRWVRLPIDRWSLATLGVPIYPQDRFQLGVALAVSRDARLDREIRVVLRSASDRLSGQRKTELLVGRPELLRAADRYFFSAKPR